ncbi:peptidase E [Heyndrickxia acidicola]|uniref:Peptidase E n=1 Tax=Heyndrickxia acidicola TaxID=209389 RepID=A0ABU6MFG3_9BACI|nr:peptidase E [Heyndrickxia acidicola]MED1203423.1 peptidase E [Heyndrickxia acidicola]
MKQIIAMGGGGFSMEPENVLLDQYVLEQARCSVPKICFIPTASGDAESYIERFYHAFQKLSCVPSHLSLFKPPASDLSDFIMEKDILYVGGGNTKNLLALWKDWGLDHLLKKAWENGKVLAGISAGSICWFEEGMTDSYGSDLRPLSCLGFLKGSNCPHYDGEEERRPSYYQALLEGDIQSGYAADDGAALHFMGQELYRAVSSRPYAKAYRVERAGNAVIESAIVTDYLGEDGKEDEGVAL